MVGPLKPHFRGQKAIMSDASGQKTKPLNHPCQGNKRFEIDGVIVDKSGPAPDSKEHVHAICCRPEEVDGVTSGRNVQTVEGYVAITFASSESFRDNRKISFIDGGGGGFRR